MKQTETTKSGIAIKSAKVMVGIILSICILFTVKAMVMDTVLESLESSYKQALATKDKTANQVITATELDKLANQSVCSTYVALRAYKEAKGLEVKNKDMNPCQAVIESSKK